MSVYSTIKAPRQAKRTRVLMTAVLITPAGKQKVKVRDISRTGVQIVGAKDLPCDCDAIFHRESIFAAARIAWVSGSEAGVHFYRQLSAEEVEGTLPVALLRERR